jgi:hypothetical protein
MTAVLTTSLPGSIAQYRFVHCLLPHIMHTAENGSAFELPMGQAKSRLCTGLMTWLSSHGTHQLKSVCEYPHHHILFSRNVPESMAEQRQLHPLIRVLVRSQWVLECGTAHASSS